jgi:hypothetical protein
MVNRRLLRVKAFQQLYAFYTQERAQYQLAFDGLATIFQPDLWNGERSLQVSGQECADSNPGFAGSF